MAHAQFGSLVRDPDGGTIVDPRGALAMTAMQCAAGDMQPALASGAPIVALELSGMTGQDPEGQRHTVSATYLLDPHDARKLIRELRQTTRWMRLPAPIHRRVRRVPADLDRMVAAVVGAALIAVAAGARRRQK